MKTKSAIVAQTIQTTLQGDLEATRFNAKQGNGEETTLDADTILARLDDAAALKREIKKGQAISDEWQRIALEAIQCLGGYVTRGESATLNQLEKDYQKVLARDLAFIVKE